jgi:hypothetical protein
MALGKGPRADSVVEFVAIEEKFAAMEEKFSAPASYLVVVVALA